MQIAEEIGFPVVMKIVSPQILHKSDAGGVVVGIKTKEEAEQAFTRIMANATGLRSRRPSSRGFSSRRWPRRGMR